MEIKTLSADPNTVLELLRRLPPRERLRVVAQVLPELEQELPETPASANFWHGDDIRTLAERQGVEPITDFNAFLGGWPEDEPVDDFIAAIREWRQQNLAEVEVQ